MKYPFTIHGSDGASLDNQINFSENPIRELHAWVWIGYNQAELMQNQ